MSKNEQTSDWSLEELSDEQKTYAASDVLYLHKLKSILEGKLEKVIRKELAQNCFILHYKSISRFKRMV